METFTLDMICYVWMAIAAAVFVTMFFITAPFGRHSSEKWGPTINNKLGWIIMEMPSLAFMIYFLLAGHYEAGSCAWVLFACWIFHYGNRTLVYPLRIKATPKKMPLFIVVNAIVFNLVNAGINGYYLAFLAPAGKYSAAWMQSASFKTGAFLFIIGLCINWKSDDILIHLRKPGESGYKIPVGFLFSRVSAPNLLGEIIEWSGFALMAWNLPALSFAIWTFANLVPRAKNHHDWYLRHFPDYPKNRKIIFPYLF